MSESDVQMLSRQLDRVEKSLEKLSETVGKMTERCARNSQRIEHAEDSIELCHSRISGVKKWVVGGLITVASMAVKYAWALIESASNR